jgi:predicted bacteriocin transport accessory protein
LGLNELHAPNKIQKSYELGDLGVLGGWWYNGGMKQDEKHNSKGAEWVVLWVVMLALVAAIVGVIWVAGERAEQKRREQEQAESGAGEVATPDYSMLTAMNSQALLGMLLVGDSGFLYVGRPTCPHCQVFAPILTEVVAENGLEVYYLNTDAVRSEADYDTALDAVGVSGVPSFMYIRDGQVAAKLTDTTNKEKLLEFIRENSQS